MTAVAAAGHDVVDGSQSTRCVTLFHCAHRAGPEDRIGRTKKRAKSKLGRLTRLIGGRMLKN
jgi:hypothetical protein